MKRFIEGASRSQSTGESYQLRRFHTAWVTNIIGIGPLMAEIRAQAMAA
jgi:hypothetical protein